MVQSTIAAVSAEPTTTVKSGASGSSSGTTTVTVKVEGEKVKVEGVSSTGEGATTEQTATTEAKQPDNPILPTGPELLWGAGCFLLLWALMKFWLLKPVQQTMQERSEKVRTDIESADAAKTQAVSAIAEYESTLSSARVEASRIIDDARAAAEADRKAKIAAAEAEVAELRATANAEVAAAKAEALASMRGTVATIAVQAAEAVIQKPLDVNASRAIVDEYLNRVGSQN